MTCDTAWGEPVRHDAIRRSGWGWLTLESTLEDCLAPVCACSLCTSADVVARSPGEGLYRLPSPVMTPRSQSFRTVSTMSCWRMDPPMTCDTAWGEPVWHDAIRRSGRGWLTLESTYTR
jgi:hypothetical protein